MTMPPVWLASLQALVGTDQCETESTRLQEYAVDGLIPSVVIRPETAEQVAAVLQWAQGEKLAVLPRGSGTAIRLGSMAQRCDIVLSTSRLTLISEYDAANFTITAGAGMTCSQLSQVTAVHRQLLPLQYPFSAATLGGLIAANAYSPKRLLYGGVRDLLLGLRIALPSGEIAHFGGKVVKNVAGYDMCKLFVGSLGALGAVVEATFKLYALPERDETLLAEFPSLEQGAAAVARLSSTQLLPSQILLFNSTASGALAPQSDVHIAAGAAALLVNCEGMDEAVERQLADIAHICQGHGASTVQVLSGEAQLQLRQRLCPVTQNFAAHAVLPAAQPASVAGHGVDGDVLSARLGTLPSQVYTVMQAAVQALHPIAPGVVIIGDCGVGLVTLCLRPDSLAVSALETQLLPALRELRRLVVALGGYAVVDSASPAVKTLLEVWGSTPSSFVLLKALKDRFDPEGVLSPGRFIGGL